MKSLREIKKKAEKGDHTRIAESIGISPELVRKVVYGHRTDHYNIQRAFSDLLEAREKVHTRIIKRNKKLQTA